MDMRQVSKTWKLPLWTKITCFCIVMCIWLGVGMVVMAMQNKPQICKMDCAFNDDIALRYYVSVPDSYTAPYMKFEMNGQAYTVTEAQKEADYYIFSFEKMLPQYLTYEVKASLYATNGGKVKSYDTMSESVQGYCKTLLEASAQDLEISDEKYTAMQRMIADLMNYGAEAQRITGVAVSNLANQLSANGTSVSSYASTFKSLSSKNKIWKLSKDSNKKLNCEWKSCSVQYDKLQSYSYTFAVDKSIDVKDLLLKVTKESNQKTYVIWDFQREADAAGKAVYTAKFTNLEAAECGTKLNAQLYIDGQAEGQILTSSFSTYVYNTQNNQDAMAKLARAFWLYGKSSLDYAVNIAFDEKFDAANFTVQIKNIKNVNAAAIERVVEKNHTVSLSGVSSGTYEVFTNVFGLTQSLGNLTIDGQTINYTMDLSKAFQDCKDIETGDVTFNFAENSATFSKEAEAHGILKVNTEIAGPFSVTAKYQIDEQELFDQYGQYLCFGVRMTGKTEAGENFTDQANLYMKKSSNANEQGALSIRGSKDDNAWTYVKEDALGKINYQENDGYTWSKETKYSKALIGDGLWVKYERTADGTMNVYLGVSEDNMSYAGSMAYKNTTVIEDIYLQFNHESADTKGYTASIENVKVSVADEIQITATGVGSAEGLALQFVPSAGVTLSGTVNAENKVNLLAEPGTYDVKANVFGMTQTLKDALIVEKGQTEYSLDLSKLFADCEDLATGDVSYDFASNSATFSKTATAHGVLKLATEITGPFSVTAKYQIDEQELFDQYGQYLCFGVRMIGKTEAGESVTDQANLYMKKSSDASKQGTLSIRGSKVNNAWSYVKEDALGKVNYQETDGYTWGTETDYSKALIGDGLWIKYERTADGTMNVYLGVSEDEMFYAGSMAYKNTTVIKEIYLQFNHERADTKGYIASIENVKVSVADEIQITAAGIGNAEGLALQFVPSEEVTLNGTVNAENKVSLLAEPGTYDVKANLFGITQTLEDAFIVEEGQTEYSLDLSKLFVDCADLATGDVSFDFASNSATFSKAAEAHGVLKLPTEIAGPFSVTAKYKISEQELFDQFGVNLCFGVRMVGLNADNTEFTDQANLYATGGGSISVRGSKVNNAWSYIQKNAIGDVNYTEVDGYTWNDETDYSKALIGDGLWIKYERTADGTMNVYLGVSEDKLAYAGSMAYKNTSVIQQIYLQFNHESADTKGYQASIENVKVSLPNEIQVKVNGFESATGLALSMKHNACAGLTGVTDQNNCFSLLAEPGTYQVNANVFGVEKSVGNLTVAEGTSEYSIDVSSIISDTLPKISGNTGVTYDFTANSVMYQTDAGVANVQNNYTDVDLATSLKGPFSVTAQYQLGEEYVGNALTFSMMLVDSNNKSDGISFGITSKGIFRFRTGKYTASNYIYMQDKSNSLLLGQVSDSTWHTTDVGKALTGDGLWVKYDCASDGTVTIYAGTSKDSMTKIYEVTDYKMTSEIKTLRLRFYPENGPAFEAAIKNIEILSD